MTVTVAGAGEVTETARAEIADPNDTVPPVMTLDLGDCPDIYDLCPVTGSVSDPGGVSYKLQSSPVSWACSTPPC